MICQLLVNKDHKPGKKLRPSNNFVGQDKYNSLKVVIIFLSTSLYMHSGYSKEPSP